jgi:TIR domain
MTNTFRDQIQVVLQVPEPSNAVVCRCFGHIHSPNPALISVIAVGESQATQAAQRLGRGLVRTLQSIGTPVAAPCGASSKGPIRCWAAEERAALRVLVAIGDGSVAFDNTDPEIAHWLRNIGQGNRFFVLLPCLPESQKNRTSSLLKGPLAKINASYWKTDPTEMIPVVFSAAGISPEDYRLFISYRRNEGQILAEQLFDELNRRNFDVFVDQFRMNPGVNFQERLTDELAHKAMIVVLETATINQSPWVNHEISYAVANRLGILAIQPPTGQSVPSITSQRRIVLPIGSLKANGTLKDDWLKKVCNRVTISHALAMIRRRYQLRQALRNALLLENVSRQAILADGYLEAYTAPGYVGGPYHLWCTPRPAELTDFHTVAIKSGRSPQRAPVLISPGVLLPGRRQIQMRWLANTCQIGYYDESEIPMIAKKISQGAL